MLVEIQCNISDRRCYALNESGTVIGVYAMGTSYYSGYNEEGQPYQNAERGTYNDGNVYAEIYDQTDNDPAYGWAYINIDERGHALHGGGTNLGDEANDPFQPLLPTLGCFRMYNADVYHLAQMFIYSVEQGCKPIITVIE